MVKKNNCQILWDQFYQENKLSIDQLEKFKRYYNLLIDYNKKHNITSIIDLKDFIINHFKDSLSLSYFIESNKDINFIADIGSGGGFPGIPLKIKFDNLKVILIEVIQKKIDFLNIVIKDLDLKNIEISNLDWRTFLKNTNYKIDLFCARASLRPNELIRAFKPNSFYINSQIVYFANKNFEPNQSELKFISKIYDYDLDLKSRKLIFLKNFKDI